MQNVVGSIRPSGQLVSACACRRPRCGLIAVYAFGSPAAGCSSRGRPLKCRNVGATTLPRRFGSRAWAAGPRGDGRERQHQVERGRSSGRAARPGREGSRRPQGRFNKFRPFGLAQSRLGDNFNNRASCRECARAQSGTGGGAAVAPQPRQPAVGRQAVAAAVAPAVATAAPSGRVPKPHTAPPPPQPQSGRCARAELAAAQPWPGRGEETMLADAQSRLAEAQARAQAYKPVGMWINSAQDKLDGLTTKSASLRAERQRLLSQVAKLGDGGQRVWSSRCCGVFSRPDKRASRYRCAVARRFWGLRCRNACRRTSCHQGPPAGPDPEL